YSHRIVYGEELDQLWADAVARSGEPLDFEAKFYQDEWSKVAHAHEAYTWEEYAQAPRRGRGVRLARRSRLAVWRVFEEYRNLCDERRVRDVETAMHECRQLIAKHCHKPLYAAIVVDEGQDFSASAYRLLRAMAGP